MTQGSWLIFQVYIGIVTSLIVFPVNLVIVQIFRSVKPKPHRIRNKPAKTASHALPRLSLTVANLEDYRRIKEPCGDSTRGSENSLELTQEKNDRMRLSINDVHTDVDRVSFTSSPLLVARKSSPEYGGTFPYSFRVLQSSTVVWVICCRKGISDQYGVGEGERKRGEGEGGRRAGSV